MPQCIILPAKKGCDFMKVTLLQPSIQRGNINNNKKIIQKLIHNAQGELLILPEYALTGSLVLDPEADLLGWTSRIEEAISSLHIPSGKEIQLNYLENKDDLLYNCNVALPSGKKQFKLYPDPVELERGIQAGLEEQTFTFGSSKYKVIICTDMRYIHDFNLDGLDFIIFVYHCTAERLDTVLSDMKEISTQYNLPILLSSLVSDKNIGYSSYIYKSTIVSLPNQEGLLEIEL